MQDLIMKGLPHYFKETELHVRKKEVTEWGFMIRYALYKDLLSRTTD